MQSVWNDNKVLKKWYQKHYKHFFDGNFNFNLMNLLDDPLINSISNYLSVPKEYIYPAAGSSQIIADILNADLWNTIFLSDIEFPLYNRNAKISGKRFAEIKGKTAVEFIKNLKQTKSSKSDLLCLSSPRWFSGESFKQKDIENMLFVFKGNILIDESYIDYSDNANGMLDVCLKNERVLLLRTFSKTFFVSGLRVGFLITKKEIKGLRDTIIAPHSVSTHSANFMIKLLSDERMLKLFYNSRQYIKQNRELIYNAFKDDKKMRIIKSDANFITMIFDSNEEMMKIYENIKCYREVQMFDNTIPFIKIWISNCDFSKKIIKEIREAQI